MKNFERVILTEDISNCQKAFRILLDAMSHPGRMYDLNSLKTESHLYLIIKTLIDNEVTFSVIGTKIDELSKEISLLTGARRSSVEEADFLIITEGKSRGKIEKAKIGTLEYPDRGATLIYYIDSKNSGPVYLRLLGPGIMGEHTILINGIAKDEFLSLKKINKNYPLGLDSIFVKKSGEIFCIPRSTRILEVY